MEHDHQSSKGEDKAAGTRARKNATSYLSSDARAVFDLQQAAGNRAVAKMLTSPAGGRKVQRSPVAPMAGGTASPVAVQRANLPFDKALSNTVNDQGFDTEEFAKALLEVTKGSSKDGGTGGTGKTTKSKWSSGKPKSDEELKKQETELYKSGTPEARAEARRLKKKEAALDALEDRRKNEDDILDLSDELKLNPPLTEKDLSSMKDDEVQGKLDDLKEQKKNGEDRAKWMKKTKTPKMSQQSVASLYKSRGLFF